MANDPDYEVVMEQLQVLRAQTGDADAYRLLFEKYNDRLHYFLSRLLGNSIDAEDVLQEVWVLVIRKIGDLKQPLAFKSWLYRVAHNQAVSRMRKRYSLTCLNDVSDEDLVDANDVQTDELIQRYSPAAIHKALDELTVHHSEVLTLRFLEQLSYEEMARVIGCSPGTVRSRLYYAKKSLKRFLEKNERNSNS